MANYVCRTCLYVCDNEFSFKKFDKVKTVLELFVPEITKFSGSIGHPLICEQCYYFLKNVEKFKIKCVETHETLLSSMNPETIRDRRDALLRSVAGDFPAKRSGIDGNRGKAKKPKSIAPTFSTPMEANRPKKRAREQEGPPGTNGSSSVSEDLLRLFDMSEDSADAESFREFAVNEGNSNGNSAEDKSGPEGNGLTKDDDDDRLVMNDLVSVGILPNESANATPTESDNDLEIIDIDSDDENSNVDGRRVEIKMAHVSGSTGNNASATGGAAAGSLDQCAKCNTAIIKQELVEEENPGFFNKKSADGYYKCRLCGKPYKTSQGLYAHTKAKHGDEIRLHHCKYCSFFTLWRTSLARHYGAFHAADFRERQRCQISRRYHCSFQTRPKDDPSRHIILRNHVYDENCTSRNETFYSEGTKIK